MVILLLTSAKSGTSVFLTDGDAHAAELEGGEVDADLATLGVLHGVTGPL